jgi:hypothetical protein
MQLRKGMIGSCKISGKQVDKFVVQEEDGEFYLGQDVMDGEECSDKLGFKYSWHVGKGTPEDLKKNDVTDLVILNKTIDDIATGDVVVNRSVTRKILARVDDVVCLSYAGNFNKAQNWYTIQELKDEGYTVLEPKPEPKLIKVKLKGGEVVEGEVVE